jgi:hypothetical protein
VKPPALEREIDRFADRVVRRLVREIRKVQSHDWGSLGPSGRTERDRYCQGMSDAAELVRHIQAMPVRRVYRRRARKQKRGKR